LQGQIDQWNRQHKGASDPAAQEAFLRSIGYIVPEKGAFKITTGNVDPEIAQIAGPQLVVPVMNARYALNAANARWGSLYDALYGTDAIPQAAPLAKGFDRTRGAKVIAWAREFLDWNFPVRNGSWKHATSFRIVKNKLEIGFQDGSSGLKIAKQFVGYRGAKTNPSHLLLVHNGLHAEIVIDRSGFIGLLDPAGINGVAVEAAISVIMDCEDSVAAVDAEDKVEVYRNWLGLMKGTLTEEVSKGSSTFTRRLAEDRVYKKSSTGILTLKGRALMLVRNVGHLMTTPAIVDREGYHVPEGLMDAVITALVALHDEIGRAHV
jgi:malate synthase